MHEVDFTSKFLNDMDVKLSYMPKPGYTCITLKTEVARLLKEYARERGLGLNKLILQLLREEDCPGTVPSMMEKQPQFKLLLRKEAGPVGFEPTTDSLGGCRAILVAHPTCRCNVGFCATGPLPLATSASL